MARRGASWLKAIGAALLALAAAPLAAQAVGEAGQAPVRQSIDENGVDVIRGTYMPPPKTWLSIGPGDTRGLALERIGGIDGIDSLSSAVKIAGNLVTLNFGTRSESFVADGSGGYTSTEGNGATLIAVGSNALVYTGRDGTHASFTTTAGSQYAYFFSVAGWLSNITYPDGTGFSVGTKVSLYSKAGMRTVSACFRHIWRASRALLAITAIS